MIPNRKPLVKYSNMSLKKELKICYYVLNSTKYTTSLSYKIASQKIKKIEEILDERKKTTSSISI